MNQLNVWNVKININYKFDDISDILKEDIFKLIEKWFTQKLDRYLEKGTSPENPEAHLQASIKKNSKWLFDGNFNLKVWNTNVIYKREWFKNVFDLVNHFFDHAKEEFSKK